MNIINITDEDISSSNRSDNITLIEISPLFVILITIIPCSLSILCCVSFMIYSFIKLIKK